MDDWRHNLTFTVGLPPKSEEALKERATALGVDVPTYVSKLVDHLANCMVREKESTLPERVVFDPRVYELALLDPKGPARACLAKVESGQVQPIVSEQLFEELRSFNRASIELPDVVETLIQDLKKTADVVESVPEVYVHPEDEKASHYANLAIATGVDGVTVVSRDSHLLKLMDVRDSLGKDFTSRFPSVRIVTPETFLSEREGTPAKQEKPVANPTLQRDQTHVLDVARRAEHSRRVDRTMDRSPHQNKDRGHEK